MHLPLGGPGCKCVEVVWEHTSLLLTITFFTPIPTDTKPVLPQLLKFPGKSGIINIPEKIGPNVQTFGILLLEDENGAKVDAITKEEKQVKDVVLTILKKWLRGEGVRPVTWRTLIQIMRDSEFDELANDVEAIKSDRH